MLYTKPYFAPQADEEIFDLVDRVVLGTLITPHEEGVAISHPIFMADRKRNRLVSHLAAGNDHTDLIRHGLPSVAVLMDAGSYISSSWYPAAPARDSAPTWNFMVVHFHGKPELMSTAATAKHLSDLVSHMEKGRDKAWKMGELGPGGLERRLPNILGYELPIERVETRFKLGQDERRRDMLAAEDKLREEGKTELAARMAQYRPEE
ncbi:FMN-binding negative transcriptional regulator [Rhizobiaceae bacterium BDR2-2]|uniref:FMN-binding negative transcriptional regulator n=1 Tax=Ectorhizobium quercum TaxID=2965071 RepID=A0AAE3MYC4_9HYPH|nr:FMN-binding negative transcriptional regulator [Ectorhizobium quercum]MCX8995910.1 FMN-binding negative transcriptional regulator [Ectorhizobium quercum]